MKIKSIDAVRVQIPGSGPPSKKLGATSVTSPQKAIDHPAKTGKTPPRRESWTENDEVANPMSRYPHVKRHRSRWLPSSWGAVWCKVTLEDGSWGLGSSVHGRPVAAVIEDHLAIQLVGQDVMAGEKISDMMFRLTKPYGTVGLASYAISAVDLAIWDVRGKILEQPVYEMLGGKQKESLRCYSTGNDVDWNKELGFTAFKLACPYGPADGLEGLKKNEEFVAAARDEIGNECELMLDCWMAFDVEYTVRLAERLRPYGLKWLEECLLSEDFDAHYSLRQRLPWQGLATGEHWFTHVPFQWACSKRVVDILQPDIQWVGGMTTCMKIAAVADASGISVIPHGGAGTPFGQHFSIASGCAPLSEYFVGSPPGVPLDELPGIPGVAVPSGGHVTPSDAPGFGMEIKEEWLTPFF